MLETASLHRSAIFIQGLWRSGRARLTPLAGQALRSQRHLSASNALRQVVHALTKPQAAAHSASLRFATRPPPPRLPATRASRGIGRQAFTRPSVRKTHDVGLGTARSFSTGGNPTIDVLYNAPLILRAAMDFLDCPSERVRMQASQWRRTAVVSNGKIGLDGQRCVPSAATASSSAELFFAAAQPQEEQQEEAGLELIIPVEPRQSIALDLDAAHHSEESLLSPALMAELHLCGSQQRRHWKALEQLLSVLRDERQLGKVQLVTLSNREQVFRVGVCTWTEGELREALGLYESDDAFWIDAVDWRVVHEGDVWSDSDPGCQEDGDDDLVYPTADSCGSVWDVGWASSESNLSSGSEGGMGPASLLSDLGGLRSPTFEAWTRL